MKGSPFGFENVKVVALPVTDKGRADRFYGETLALEAVYEGDEKAGYLLGATIIMLKDDFYALPTELPNPRITIAVTDALVTEKALKERGVVIRDAVQLYDDGYNIGSFLDSEGNKLWFCSPVT